MLAVSPLETISGGEQGNVEQVEEPVNVEDMDNEAIVPDVVPEVSSPTEKEVKDHEVAHLPYRSWCAHCVRGKGLERACSSEGHVVGCVPCVCDDYMFLGEHDKSGTTSSSRRQGRQY